MKARCIEAPRPYLLIDAGLCWPGAIDWMPCHLTAEGDLGDLTPANDLERPSCRELPAETEESLRQIAREYRRLFGSTQPRGRLGGAFGRLLLGRRPIG